MRERRPQKQTPSQRERQGAKRVARSTKNKQEAVGPSPSSASLKTERVTLTFRFFGGLGLFGSFLFLYLTVDFSLRLLSLFPPVSSSLRLLTSHEWKAENNQNEQSQRRVAVKHFIAALVVQPCIFPFLFGIFFVALVYLCKVFARERNSKSKTENRRHFQFLLF